MWRHSFSTVKKKYSGSRLPEKVETETSFTHKKTFLFLSQEKKKHFSFFAFFYDVFAFFLAPNPRERAALIF
jgi:hypothetical protein